MIITLNRERKEREREREREREEGGGLIVIDDKIIMYAVGLAFKVQENVQLSVTKAQP